MVETFHRQVFRLSDGWCTKTTSIIHMILCTFPNVRTRRICLAQIIFFSSRDLNMLYKGETLKRNQISCQSRPGAKWLTKSRKGLQRDTNKDLRQLLFLICDVVVFNFAVAIVIISIRDLRITKFKLQHAYLYLAILLVQTMEKNYFMIGFARCHA